MSGRAVRWRVIRFGWTCLGLVVAVVVDFVYLEGGTWRTRLPIFAMYVFLLMALAWVRTPTHDSALNNQAGIDRDPPGVKGKE